MMSLVHKDKRNGTSTLDPEVIDRYLFIILFY